MQSIWWWIQDKGLPDKVDGLPTRPNPTRPNNRNSKPTSQNDDKSFNFQTQSGMRFDNFVGVVKNFYAHSLWPLFGSTSANANTRPPTSGMSSFSSSVLTCFETSISSHTVLLPVIYNGIHTKQISAWSSRGSPHAG